MLKARSDSFDGYYTFSITVLVLGLYLDSYANNNFPSRASELFTYWHILLFLGFFSSTLTMLVPTVINKAIGKSFLDAIPNGYSYSLLGSLFFTIGSIGDFIWIKHFPQSHLIESRFNPPTTLIAIGAFLMFTGPIIKMKAFPIDSWNNQLNILLPLIYMTVDILFISQFASPFNLMIAAEGNEPVISETANFAIEAALLGFIFYAIVITSSFIFAMRNWNLTTGSTFLFFFVTILLISTLSGYFIFIIQALVIGILMEVIYQLYLKNEPEFFEEVIAISLPLFMHSSYFILVFLTIGLSWGPTLWLSVILMSCFINLILAILMKSNM